MKEGTKRKTSKVMGAKSFHARTRPRSAAASQLNTGGEIHVCHICLKHFSRRDLRERHRRRCEKSIGKIIPTKKRSCERCISFKVKCDYKKPSCTRCVTRSAACEYKLEPRIKMPLNPAFSMGPNTAFSGSLDFFSMQDGMNNAFFAFDPSQQEQMQQMQMQQQHIQEQQHQAHQLSHDHHHQQQQARQRQRQTAAQTAREMGLGELSPSLVMNLIHEHRNRNAHDGFHTASTTLNDCQPRSQCWPSPDGMAAAAEAPAQDHGLRLGLVHDGSQSHWDDMTVWSDGSSGLLMLDDASVMESSGWTASLLDLPPPYTYTREEQPQYLLFSPNVDHPMSENQHLPPHHHRQDDAQLMSRHVGQSAGHFGPWETTGLPLGTPAKT